MLKNLLLTTCFLGAMSFNASANEKSVVLEEPKIDLTDYASLQRGAALFVNRCQSCHSLKYMRYDSLAKGLAITDERGIILKDAMQKNLMFAGGQLSDKIVSSVTDQDAVQWFGMVPPDLTLEVRARSAAWLYTYLKSFYKDDGRPFGVNNIVFPDVGMPFVLADLQGEQELTETGLKITKPGKLSPTQYEATITDLVAFLSFAAEPTKMERKHLGGFVLMFLGIFMVFTYLLRREYWKDIK
jgi:ubiquinol-cytochrome c reductase cytochrome c1 subunit